MFLILLYLFHISKESHVGYASIVAVIVRFRRTFAYITPTPSPNLFEVLLGPVYVSESGPRLTPEVARELIPADDSGTEKVGDVAVEHALCGFRVSGVERHPRLLDKGELAEGFFGEIVAGGLEGFTIGTPANSGEAVGLAIVPERGVVAVGVLTADL